MTIPANNQCPNCGHAFSDWEMLFWGFSKTSNCPDCNTELGVNRDRMLMLWVGGVVAVMFIELQFSLDSVQGWAALTAFILLFCLVAVRVQKLEIKK